MSRSFLTIAALLAGLVSVAAAEHPDQVSCSPVSVCGDAAPSGLPQCPDGHTCVCVPTCPVCADCAAKVCVPAAIACHNSCECPDGMGCTGGTCKADAKVPLCCDDEECPGGERCQNPDGSFAVCGPALECRTACDCSDGLACIENQCIAATAPVYCCEGNVCPAGEQCQSGRTGEMGRCGEEPECRTACDCSPGLGCFEGRCIAGFAPVFCCESDACPAGNQCQHRDGRMDRCGDRCIDTTWLCQEDDSGVRRCGDNRVCSCTASCPDCEDCGTNVCMPPNSPTPYRCEADGTCENPRDKCICVSSCPQCDDCALSVCVPSCGADDPMCRKRLSMSQRRIHHAIDKTNECTEDEQCVLVDTDTQCMGACGAFVNRRYARRVQNFIDYVDERFCTGYQEDGCPFATPVCQQQVGVCRDGECVGVPATSSVPVRARLSARELRSRSTR